MKNFEIFPALSVVRRYQMRWAWMLVSVPAFCTLVLTLMLFVFAKLNLYFLESAGMIINDMVRDAYFTQVQMELGNVSGYLAVLMVGVFVISTLVMNWAVSPFISAERILVAAVKTPDKLKGQNQWLSESPLFHRMIWGLAQKVKNPRHEIEQEEVPHYRFNFRFAAKFVAIFFCVSVLTSYVLGILLDTAYGKVVSLAVNMVNLDQKGHYFTAQQEILHDGVVISMFLSCLAYLVIGISVTRYLSTMLFVFSRAVHSGNFPMRLRDSDAYHTLSHAVNDAAESAGLLKRPSGHLKAVSR